MKKIILTMAALLFAFQAHADLKIQDSRKAGFLYGFLTSIEDATNAGDGVLTVTVEISCSRHKNNDQFYCLSGTDSITGETAEIVFNSFLKETEENFDDVAVRSGTVTCLSIEVAGKRPKFSCD